MTKLRLVVVFVALGVGAILLFAVHPYFMDKYMRESPRVMTAATGNVYPYFQHGVTIFMSMRQKLVLNGVVVAGFLSLVACGVALKSWFSK